MRELRSTYTGWKERLVYEIAGNKKRKTNQEWLDLQKAVQEFLKTATEEDRKLIGAMHYRKIFVGGIKIGNQKLRRKRHGFSL